MAYMKKFDLREEEIEVFNENLYNEINEREVNMGKDEVFVLIDQKLVFGHGEYCLYCGSDCYITDDGIPEPDCNVVVVYKNKQNINFADYVYCEMQSSVESVLHNFQTLLENRRKSRENAARDLQAAKNLAYRHTYSQYA